MYVQYKYNTLFNTIKHIRSAIQSIQYAAVTSIYADAVHCSCKVDGRCPKISGNV